MILRQLCLALVLLLFVSAQTLATTYYVDPDLATSPDGDHQYTELTGTQAAGNCLNTAGNYYNVAARDCTGTDSAIKGYASFAVPVTVVSGGESIIIRGGTYTVGQYGSGANYVNPGILITDSWPYANSNIPSTLSKSNRIEVKNHTGEDVVFVGGAASSYGIIINTNWVYVHGEADHPMQFNNIKFGLTISGGNSNEIAYCNFDQPYNAASIAEGLGQVYNNSNYNWIHHNVFSRSGGQSTTFDGQYAFRVGSDEINQTAPADNSMYNIVENNEFWGGGHAALGVNSRYNVVRNNYVHHEPWIEIPTGSGDYWGYHVSEVSGSETTAGYSLFEGNFFGYGSENKVGNYGGSGMKLQSQENTVRYNDFVGNWTSGIYMRSYGHSEGPLYEAYPYNNRIYNNSFYENGRHPVSYKDQPTYNGSSAHGIVLEIAQSSVYSINFDNNNVEGTFNWAASGAINASDYPQKCIKGATSGGIAIPTSVTSSDSYVTGTIKYIRKYGGAFQNNEIIGYGDFSITDSSTFCTVTDAHVGTFDGTASGVLELWNGADTNPPSSYSEGYDKVYGNLIKNNLLKDHSTIMDTEDACTHSISDTAGSWLNLYYYTGEEADCNIDPEGIKPCVSYQTVLNNWDVCLGDADPKFVASTSKTGNYGTTTHTYYPYTDLPAYDSTSPKIIDLSLNSDSPAIDKGTYLTTVSSVTDSDTLVVDESKYFFDGKFGTASGLTTNNWPTGTSIEADYICLTETTSANISNCVQISAINYSTNTIDTLSVHGASSGWYVWLYKISDGTLVLYNGATDMGAHEYVLSSSIAVTPSVVGDGGTISPATVSNVESGSDSHIYTAIPYNGWKIKEWSGTCGATGISGTYQKTGVTEACTVTIEFEEIKLLPW